MPQEFTDWLRKLRRHRMKNNLSKKMSKLLKKPWAAYTMATCSAALLYFVLTNLAVVAEWIRVIFTLIAPILWGLIFAYLIDPLVLTFEKKIFKKMKREGLRRGISVVFAVLVVLIILTVLVGTLVPSIAGSVSSIMDKLDAYTTDLANNPQNYGYLADMLNIDVASIMATSNELLHRLIELITTNSGVIASKFVSVGTSFVNIVIGFILAVYFLGDKKNLVLLINKLRAVILKDVTYESHNKFWSRCHKILIKYLVFDILDGIVIGIINAVFMLICGMPNVALVSVIVGVTNLLPTFGPVIGGFFGALVLLLNSPMQALIFLIFTVVLQTFDGYILKPKMFGDSMGVSAVWILVSIVLGGKLFGVVGILLAIPFAGIFTFMMAESIYPWLEDRKIRKTGKTKDKVEEEIIKEEE